MAINKQKLLPSSGSSAAIIKSTIKTSAISKSLAKPSSAIAKADDIKVSPEDLKTKDPSLSIYKKVINIDKLLKNNFKLQSKTEESRKKESESKKKEGREKELETPKKFKGFQILKNALPQTGIVDAVKRFIIFTFAGWAFTQLFQFLPKLLDIVKFITPIYSWFEKGIGMLFEGFVSFIDFGYKAYDSVRGLTKQIGGENFQKTFDDFSSNLNKFLNLAITAAMIAASTGGFGKGGRGGRPPVGPRVTPRGKPRVTTSGGRPAGRPGVRSPIRQKPTVTTSGGKPAGKFQLPKGAGALTKGARGIIGVGTILDLGVRIASGQPVSKAVVGAAGGAIGAGIGTWLGGAIGGVAGSVVPVIGNLLLGGAGATIGGILGGMLGGGIADALYDAVTGYGKKNDIQKKATGGLVQNKIRKPSTPQRRRTKIQSPIKKISKTKIQPGKDVGGKKKIEKLYPNPENKLFGIIPMPGEFSWLDFIFGGKKTEAQKNVKKGNIPNALKALVDTGETLGKSGDWVGALMKAGIQVALGEVPDVKSIASAITQVINTARTPAIQGIETIRKELQGFANGGLVSVNSMSSETNSLLLERALEGTIKKRVDDALNSVRREVRKRGPVGRDEMLEANRRKGAGGGPGAGAPSVGGEGTDISKISMEGFSEQDIDALGRMIAAESENQPKLGKAGVLSVILNRYRLAKAGKGYLPSGKTKDNVTIRDILYAPNQFSPIKDGRFDRTSSNAGKKALADAISGGGNDPQKFKEFLVKQMKLKESDAETVVRATAFSNPQTRGSRPFDTPEVAIGDHSFQESPFVRIKSFPGAIKADVKKEVSQYSGDLSNKFLKNLDIKLPEVTLSGQRYGASREGGGRAHAGRDYDLSDNDVFHSRTGGVVTFIGNDPGGYGLYIDIYNKDLDRTERIAEGTTILSGIKIGSTVSPGQPIVQGTHQTGVIHYEIRKGKSTTYGVSGTEDPDEFLNSADYKNYISKIKSGDTVSKEPKVGSVLKSTKIGEGYVLTIRQGEKNQKEYYLNGRKLSSTETSTYQKNHPSAFQISEQKKETWLDKLNPFKIKPSPAPKPQVAGGGMGGKRGTRGMQGGGFISPSKSNVPNVSSRAYYETPGSSSLIAILPIEITQTVPVPVGGGAIFDSFPIAGLNNTKNSYGLMRG